MADKSFHIFSRLPTELRLEIWRLCLPSRVWELDVPTAQAHYFNPDDPNGDGPYPCNVKCTAILNGLPPVITRVCQESRNVAHESTGIMLYGGDEPLDDAFWCSTTSNNYTFDFWIDLNRGSAHLNWHPLYEAIYQDSCGSALASLAWETLTMFGRPSIMSEWFSLPCDQETERFDVFEQVPSWRVIMRVVIVHSSSREATQSGLFGLLGDATVQIVSVSNEEKVNALYAFADEHDRQFSSVNGLERVSSEVLKQELKDNILTAMRSEKLLSKMHPAIMFRLCISRCNKPVKERLLSE